MKKFMLLLLLIPAVWLIAASIPDREYVADTLMLQLVDTANQERAIEELCARHQDINLVSKRQLSKRLGFWLVTFNADSLTTVDVMHLLEVDPLVKRVQLDHYVEDRQTLPNDDFFSQQWALNNDSDHDIDAPEAWARTTGGLSSLGDTIVIAILDSGFDLNHDDISYFKNIHENPYNGIDDDENGYVDDYHGWNAYSHNGGVTPANHGTHVAGIAAARGNNLLGVSGVNWDVKVMPVLASSSTESVVVEGYDYVLEMRSLYNETNGARGAFVVATNASFGADGGNPVNYPLWCQMYDALGEVGVLSVGSTTNHPWDIDVVHDMPSACASDYLITCTNTTNADELNSGAAYGATTIDLGAPGTDIYSTLINDSYGYFTGTSMASPHVTGAISLLWASASTEFMLAARTNPEQAALVVKNAILQGVDQVPSLQGITVTGGRLNVKKSMNILMNSDTANETPAAELATSLTAYPNPFNPQTTIVYNLNKPADVKLNLYNLLGRKIATLDSGHKAAGKHQITLDGDSIAGRSLPSGIYFARLQAGTTTTTQKLMLLK